jgi:hypothetical protein
LVQIILNYETMWWLRLFGLALELLLPPSSFSARGVSAFHFLTLEDFIRSARIVIFCHVKAHPPTTHIRSKSSLKCLIRYSGWPSDAGMTPVTVYVRAVLNTIKRAVIDHRVDLEFVAHFTGRHLIAS